MEKAERRSQAKTHRELRKKMSKSPTRRSESIRYARKFSKPWIGLNRLKRKDRLVLD